MKLLDVLGFVLRILGGTGSRSVSMSTPIVKTGYEKYDVLQGGFVPTWIVLHHSDTIDDAKADDWVGIRRYHMSFRYRGDIITEIQYNEYKAAGKTEGLERPWRDIGYNLGIEDVDGKLVVQKGRQLGSLGAHALGFNDCSIGVCLVGDWDKAPPDEDRLFLLASVCRDLIGMFGIAQDHVIGHRETYTRRGVPVEKTCPGASFDLDAFRKRLTI